MDLSKIMAISGKSGLFKIVSQSRGSIIVESLLDGKKFPVFATHRSSVLEDISMFTYSEDVPLKKVLWSIYQKEDGKEVSIDIKSDGSVLKNYFESILPDFDQERVYPSDIKKVLTWYNQLLAQDLISEPVDESEAEAESDKEEATEEKTGEEKAPEESNKKKSEAKKKSTEK